MLCTAGQEITSTGIVSFQTIKYKLVEWFDAYKRIAEVRLLHNFIPCPANKLQMRRVSLNNMEDGASVRWDDYPTRWVCSVWVCFQLVSGKLWGSRFLYETIKKRMCFLGHQHPARMNVGFLYMLYCVISAPIIQGTSVCMQLHNYFRPEQNSHSIPTICAVLICFTFVFVDLCRLYNYLIQLI